MLVKHCMTGMLGDGFLTDRLANHSEHFTGILCQRPPLQQASVNFNSTAMLAFYLQETCPNHVAISYHVSCHFHVS